MYMEDTDGASMGSEAATCQLPDNQLLDHVEVIVQCKVFFRQSHCAISLHLSKLHVIVNTDMLM